MTFYADLQFSRFYEIETLKYFPYDEYEQAPSDQSFSLWDIKIIKDGVTTTHEIKTDKRALETGNIAIEYYNRGRDSGIKTTKCDYWCHYCIDPLGGYQLYVIPRKDLIKMINRGEYKRIAKTTDDSHFVLIEMKKLKKYLFKTVW
jgi:hypothetical protein